MTPQAPRPGFEIRARTLAEILDGSFQLLCRHAPWLLGISALYDGAPGLIDTFFNSLHEETEPTPSSILSTLLFSTSGFLSSYAAAWGLARRADGLGFTFAELVRAPWRAPVVVTALWVGAFYTAALQAPGLLFLPANIIVMLCVVLAAPVLALEGTGATDGLVRGIRLALRSPLKVGAAVAVLLGAGLVFVIGLLVATEAFPQGERLAVSGMYTVLGGLSNAMAFLLYVDIRCRHEAYDLEHLARQVERRSQA